jgi:hypothetical protein
VADSTAFSKIWVNPAARPDPLTPNDFKLHMRPYEHDILEAEIRGVTDVDALRWSVGTPIQARYGRNPNTWDQFYGYLASTSRNWSQTNRIATSLRVMKIVAIGASWPLKQGLQAIYPSITAAQLATTIATENYFDIDAPATPYLWETLVSPGSSTWQFLCDVAQQSGLTCHMHGTQLRFYDPMTVISQGDAVVPRFVEKDASGGTTATVLSMCTDSSEMESVEGRRRRNRVFSSVDAYNDGVFLTSDDGSSLGIGLGARRVAPIFTEYISDIVAHTQVDAEALLPAITTANRFWNRATAELSGDVRVTQATPIVLEGLGSRDSGLWQVLDVTHHVKYQWYSLKCSLGRDSDYDNGVRPGLASGLARAHLDPSATQVLSNPGTILVNGRWRSTYTSAALVGAS